MIYGGAIQNAVSGFLLMRNGTAIVQPSGISPDAKLPRAAVGLSADGNRLFLVVVNPGKNGDSDGGTTLRGLAGYLESLGASDAVTLDGSGSAQLYFHDPHTGALIQSEMSDSVCNTVPVVPRCYRPIPIFLGIQ